MNEEQIIEEIKKMGLGKTLVEKVENSFNKDKATYDLALLATPPVNY